MVAFCRRNFSFSAALNNPHIFWTDYILFHSFTHRSHSSIRSFFFSLQSINSFMNGTLKQKSTQHFNIEQMQYRKKGRPTELEAPLLLVDPIMVIPGSTRVQSRTRPKQRFTWIAMTGVIASFFLIYTVGLIWIQRYETPSIRRKLIEDEIEPINKYWAEKFEKLQGEMRKEKDMNKKLKESQSQLIKEKKILKEMDDESQSRWERRILLLQHKNYELKNAIQEFSKRELIKK